MCLSTVVVGASRKLLRVVVSSGGPPPSSATRCSLSLRMLKLIDLRGVDLRGLQEWMAFASSVLPTPVSPIMTSGAESAARAAMVRLILAMAGLRPMIS